jgi:hypothetical protein
MIACYFIFPPENFTHLGGLPNLARLFRLKVMNHAECFSFFEYPVEEVNSSWLVRYPVQAGE